MHVELNEQQRNEVYLALVDRKASILKHVKGLQSDGMTKEAELAEKRAGLYATSGKTVGLLPMFADQTDLDEERVKSGETRDPDKQQDIFGGGAETSGAPRAKEPEKHFMGKGGELFATNEEADASFKLPDTDETAAAADDASDVGAPIPQPGITPRLALMAGDGVEGEVHEAGAYLSEVETAEVDDDDDEEEEDYPDDDEEAAEEGVGDADSEIQREKEKGDDWLSEPLRTTPEA